MTTLTATDTIDVLVIEGESVYEEQMPAHITEDEDELQGWVEDWSDSFIHITENPDQHTEFLNHLLVINPDTRDVLFAGGTEVFTNA